MSNTVPEIRFKSFTRDWEQRKLGEVGTVEMCRRIFKEETSATEEIPFYKIGTFGALPDAYISREKFQEYKLKYPYPKVGDILISASGSIGRTVEYTGEDAYYQDSNIVWLNHGEHLANTFLKQFYEIVKWDGLEGSTIQRLYNKTILAAKIKIPALSEQTAIGTFFRQLDDAVSLHKRKLDGLTALKKGYLQQMFPQAGESVPRLRFGGFTGDWEVRKLGEVACITTGKLDANAMVEDGGFDFYTSGVKKYRIDISAFEGPAITIAGNGATVGYMHLADGKFNAYQRTYVLTSCKADRQFLFSEIGNKLPKKISEEARTGNIPYIVMDMLTELRIHLPCNIAEQIAIGNFFKNLDGQISAQQKKLNQLKQLKSAYLQKMFI